VFKPDPQARLTPSRCAAAVALWAATLPVQAVELSSPDAELKLRWDNTLKLSTAARLKSVDASLVVGNPNADDGDRNFGKGLISQRLDLLSEFDARYKQFGLRVSAAGWYDATYNRRNDNDSPATANTSPSNQFSRVTRRMHGRDAEVLDAFVAVNDKVAELPFTLRAGQHAMTWGETLFFGANGLIGQMVPLDLIKAASVPNTQIKEFMRPVPMLSGQLQLTPEATLGAYYQLKWSPTLLPAAGSYFSSGEITQEGDEPWYFVGAHLADKKAKNGGQGGLQLRLRGSETDYGVYLLQSHSKFYKPVVVIGPTFAPIGYRLEYKENIKTFGLSASRSFGDISWAAELSTRRGQDLASSINADLSAALGGAPSSSDNPAYAVGNTLHLNTSVLWTLPRTPLFSEALLAAELAFNRVLRVTHNPVANGQAALDPNATRDSLALRVSLEPTYRGVADGIDLSVPVGFGWAPGGSRSMALGPFATPVNATGDMSLGAQLSMYDKWYVGLNYTHYLGKAAQATDPATARFTYLQALKDRDFISLSVRASF